MTKKIRIAFYLVGIIVMFGTFILAYLKIQHLPNTVPIQTGDGGVITSYGSKYVVFIFPASMLICLFIPLLYKIPFKKSGFHLTDIAVGKNADGYISKDLLSNIFVVIALGLILILVLFEYIILNLVTR